MNKNKRNGSICEDRDSSDPTKQWYRDFVTA